jgi:hypothetical protein
MNNGRGSGGGWNNNNNNGGRSRPPSRWRGRGFYRGRGGGRGRGRGQSSNGGSASDDCKLDERSPIDSHELGGQTSADPGRWNTGSGGGGVGPSRSNSDSAYSSGSTMPPPPKKRKTTGTIKASIISAWKKKLPGYCLYYPDSPPQLSDVDQKVQLITDYLHRDGSLTYEKVLVIEEQEYFDVSCENVMLDPVLINGWPDFLKDLNDEPAEVVNLWGAVMHKVLSVIGFRLRKDGLYKMSCLNCDLKIVCDNAKRDENELAQLPVASKAKEDIGIGRIHAGLMKLEPVVPIIRINSTYIGRLERGLMKKNWNF